MITFLIIYLASALLARLLVNIRIKIGGKDFVKGVEEKTDYLKSQTGIDNKKIINAFCLFPIFNTYFALMLLRRVILIFIKSSKKQ